MWKFLLKKGVKIPLLVIGSVLLLLVLINIIVPPIAKSYVEKHSKEIVGRQINVDKVRLNIFNGKVSLIGLRAWEANDKDMFLSFEELVVNMNLWRLLAREVRLTEITLVQPKVSIWQQGSVFNFTDIIKRFSSGDQPKDTTKRSMAIDLRNITLDRGTVVYRDLLREGKFDIRDLSLAVPHLYFSGKKKSDIGLHLKFADGGDLAIKMLYGLEDSKYDLSIALKDFSVAMAKPYLKEFVNIDDFKGKLTANLQLSGCLEHILDIMAKGTISFDDLSFHKEGAEELARVKQIKVEMGQIDLLNKMFLFDEVAVSGFHFKYETDANTNTLDGLFVKKETASDSQSKEEQAQDTLQTKPVDLIINKLSLAQSSISYHDHTLRQPFSLPITDINVQAENVSLNSTCDVRLKAVVGDGGQLIGNWRGSLSDLANQKFRVKIQNVKLKNFSPLSAHYLAYPIKDGLFSFSTKNVITNNFIQSENKVDIYKCIVDKKLKEVKPEYSIPLRAAVYVLADRKGKIKIDLPVSGDIKSPNFSFRKIIFKTLLNFLVKVAVSPIDMIINAIGASEDVFSDVAYVQTDREISTETYAHLNSIIEVMQAKPEMILTVQPSVNIAEARELFAQQLATTDSVAIEEAVQRSIQHHTMMLQSYFSAQGISDAHIEILPLGDKKTPKGKSLLSFGVKFPEAMLDEEVE